eukprot:scaffold6442_cov73-Skeletonema_marinoi.AAC.18
MSTDLEEGGAAEMCCASCGITEVDDVKLQKCDACDLVRYCSDKCHEDNRPTHERACKERATELRDEILFKQPESSYLGDCPICFLPISVEFFVQSCCSKMICDGCSYANARRETKKRQTCPFCRHPVPRSKEEIDKNNNKRVAANDPIALMQMGMEYHHKGENEAAVDHLTKAAELGFGLGVEEDEKKALYHYEEAAIGAANLGHDHSIKVLKMFYSGGRISKDQFASTLRAYQAAVDATKSPQREAAAKIMAAEGNS